MKYAQTAVAVVFNANTAVIAAVALVVCQLAFTVPVWVSLCVWLPLLLAYFGRIFGQPWDNPIKDAWTVLGIVLLFCGKFFMPFIQGALELLTNPNADALYRATVSHQACAAWAIFGFALAGAFQRKGEKLAWRVRQLEGLMPQPPSPQDAQAPATQPHS